MMDTITASDIAQRYEQFQGPAKAAVARDFKATPTGKFLLVIPTGGGKTKTAIGALDRLYSEGILKSGSDIVVWVAHRDSLIEQGKTALEKEIESEDSVLKSTDVQFAMRDRLPTLLQEDQERKIKLVVIDEAHHSAAPSYQQAMTNQKIGVLGLTATPSRHDGLPLQFDKESFSIGFPDLVRLGVILKPEIVRIDGSDFDVGDLGPDELEMFNNEPRNASIVETIKANHAKFKKLIIFVGTVKHSRSLYKVLVDNGLSELYDSVAYIDGSGNSRGQPERDFFEQERDYQRSIVVSVDKLTEGYDDPSINTIIMARPLQSKLFYMQAIGRAIRRNPDDQSKVAFVVEIDDRLPNIRHKIDNRWLFADVSDVLEPAVKDVGYSFDINESLVNIYDEYHVPEIHRKFIEDNLDGPYSLLLFKKYESKNQHSSLPLLLHASNRTGIREKFNNLSERLTQAPARRQQVSQLYNRTPGDMQLGDEDHVSVIVEAMKNAATVIYNEDNAEFIEQGYPWLTFVTLRAVHNELIEFCAGMVNGEDLIARASAPSRTKTCIIRFPLTLGGFWGELLSNEEMAELDRVIEELKTLKLEAETRDTQRNMSQILLNAKLPIAPIYYHCLPSLCIESESSYKLLLETTGTENHE